MPETLFPENHPRLTADLVGHEKAERTLLRWWRAGRMPPALLIAGPRGIGKATLAYRLARFVLAQGAPSDEPSLLGPEEGAADSLAMAPDSRTFREVAQWAHPDFLPIERSLDEKTKRPRTEIVVDDTRRLGPFFSRTAARGGWRIAMVDPADEMNRNAANAVLKELEEPPRNGLVLLVCHAPGTLPPTVRSRCQTLTLRPLAPEEVSAVLAQQLTDHSDEERIALAALSAGSVGRALGIARQGGLDLYREMVGLLAPLPELDVAGIQALADRLARKTQEPLYRTFVDLLLDWVARMVSAGAEGRQPLQIMADERAAIQRLWQAGRPLGWVAAWENIRDLAGSADALNLDRRQVVINAFTVLSDAAQTAGARG